MSRKLPVPALDEEMDLEMMCAVIGCTPDDFIAELQRREAAKVAKMQTEMILAQRAGGTRRFLPDEGEGGGYVEYMIHPVSYHYWGRRLGYECWEDKQFVREYLRDNPTSRIKSVSGKTVVSFAADSTPSAAPPILGADGRPLNAAA